MSWLLYERRPVCAETLARAWLAWRLEQSCVCNNEVALVRARASLCRNVGMGVAGVASRAQACVCLRMWLWYVRGPVRAETFGMGAAGVASRATLCVCPPEWLLCERGPVRVECWHGRGWRGASSVLLDIHVLAPERRTMHRWCNVARTVEAWRGRRAGVCGPASWRRLARDPNRKEPQVTHRTILAQCLHE